MATAFRIVLLVILALAAAPAPIRGMNPRKLDDTTPTTTAPVGSPDDQLKCGSCPCNKPCYSSPPPPPPLTPSPPPPPPKNPSPKCPPPPSGGGSGQAPPSGGGGGQAPPSYIYMTGPPGSVYPIEQYVSAARRSFTVAPPLLAVAGLLGMLAFRRIP